MLRQAQHHSVSVSLRLSGKLVRNIEPVRLGLSKTITEMVPVIFWLLSTSLPTVHSTAAR